MAAKERLLLTAIVRPSTLYQMFTAFKKAEVTGYTHTEVPGAGEFEPPKLRFEAICKDREEADKLSDAIYDMAHGYEDKDVLVWIVPVTQLR